MNMPIPNLFNGLRLKRARNRLWASGLKNCGIPSLALRKKQMKTKERLELSPTQLQ